jgi:hypothetical protein
VRDGGDGCAIRHFPVAVPLVCVPAAPLRHDACIRGGQPLAVDPAPLAPELAPLHGVARRRLYRPATLLLARQGVATQVAFEEQRLETRVRSSLLTRPS